MNLNEFTEKLQELQNEIKNINVVNEKNQDVLDTIEQYSGNETILISGDIRVRYHIFYIDTDLLFNTLEQQKEKNEARLNEIKKEISELQKEDIQL